MSQRQGEGGLVEAAAASQSVIVVPCHARTRRKECTSMVLLHIKYVFEVFLC